MGRSGSRRIGILGGTFNPVHNGHLHIARQALRKLRLSKVIFIPAHIPPHKKIRGNASASDRIHMLRLATSGERRFSVSGYEIRKKGTSYSIKTARFLKKKFGRRTELFFLIGSDSLAGLGRWREIARLLDLVRFVVVPRPGFRAKSAYRGVVELKIPEKDISSSKIREFIKRGKPIGRFAPRAVFSYIKEKKLYT